MENENMYKIIDNFNAGDYTVLVVDNKLPNTSFSFANICGEVYSITIPYDIPNSIAIKMKTDINYLGKTVEFIQSSLKNENSTNSKESEEYYAKINKHNKK